MTSIKTIKAYIEVTKPKIVLLMVFVGFSSGFIAIKKGLGRMGPWGLSPLDMLLAAMLAGMFSCMGANVLANYIDRDLDLLMKRTRHRAIPSGMLSPKRALIYGFILVFLGTSALAFLNIYSAFWSLLAILDVVLVYNALTKRHSPLSILFGSFGGGAAALVTWSAVTGQFLSYIPSLMAALVVLWIPSHVWSLMIKHLDDYKNANIPALPIVIGLKPACRCIVSTTLLLMFFSTYLGIVLDLNKQYFFVLSILNSIILALALRLFLRPTSSNAWVLFKFTSPYLALLFTTVILTT